MPNPTLGPSSQLHPKLDEKRSTSLEEFRPRGMLNERTFQHQMETKNQLKKGLKNKMYSYSTLAYMKQRGNSQLP